MSIYDHHDICCHVTPLDQVEPGDQDFSYNAFSIQVVATFMSSYDSSMEEETEDLSQLYNNFECDTTCQDFVVNCDVLLNQDERARSVIRNILASVDVPIRPFMMDTILNYACGMATDNCYMGRKVLRMRVSIDVPPMDQDGADDDDQVVKFVPASKSSIEALEMVKIEGSAKQCTICLDEMLIGMEVTRMPCSHLYHGGCIRNWLERSGVCPVCRFEIA